MYNISVEQIIKVKAPTISLVYKFVAIIACVLAATTIPTTYVFGLGLLIVFIVVTVLLFKYYNAEYEYVMLNGELIVEKIMSQSMRRRCGEYNIGRATLITNPGSQDALRMEYKQLRTDNYSSNDESVKDDIIIIYALNNNNEMVRIIMQPNERMLEAIKEAAPKDAYKVEEKQENSDEKSK